MANSGVKYMIKIIYIYIEFNFLGKSRIQMINLQLITLASGNLHLAAQLTYTSRA